MITEKNDTYKLIASEILKQLGGNKFIAMTGSKNFGANKDKNGNAYLSMQLTRNLAKAKYLRITLNSSDYYDLVFFNLPIDFMDPERIIEKAKFENISSDQLQEIFTKVTGLYTKLF